MWDNPLLPEQTPDIQWLKAFQIGRLPSPGEVRSDTVLDSLCVPAHLCLPHSWAKAAELEAERGIQRPRWGGRGGKRRAAGAAVPDARAASGAGAASAAGASSSSQQTEVAGGAPKPEPAVRGRGRRRGRSGRGGRVPGQVAAANADAVKQAAGTTASSGSSSRSSSSGSSSSAAVVQPAAVVQQSSSSSSSVASSSSSSSSESESEPA